MELSKNQKVLLGVVHFLPLIGIISYFICFFSFLFGSMATINASENVGSPPPPEFFTGLISAFIIIIVTVFISIGIKTFDIIHLVQNNKGDTGNKILLWVLLFVFAGMIAEIIYYFIEIVPEKKQEIQLTKGI